MTPPDIRTWLYDAASREGFSYIKVGPAVLPATAGDGLARFLDDGFEGDMSWLRETATRRSQPQAMWPAAQSAIVCVMNYGPDHDPMTNLDHKDCGNISVYARGRDYHDVIKGRLKQFGSRFAAKTGAEIKVFVDTAPLMEKPLAAQSGAGWQGKHTNLVSRDIGSWFFLGVILTDMVLPFDQPESDHCGSCTRCLDICPTKAFPAPYRLDARRCISYLTIEHKTQIPLEFRVAIGNRIFGCDDCLAVCPWNKYAVHANEVKLQAKQVTSLPALYDLLALHEAEFRIRFAGTPVRRSGYQRFIRNVLVACGNSDDDGLVPLITMRLSDDSALVRGMAVWAMSRLVSAEQFGALRETFGRQETDNDVLVEWARSQGR
jgi:epoxyqueuosine reductase